MVSKWVLFGDYVSLASNSEEEDVFGRTSLMGWNQMLVAEDVLDRSAEVIAAAAASIAFIPFDHRCPLPCSNRSRSLRVVQRIGSTLLMRKGSRTVLTGIRTPGPVRLRGRANYGTLTDSRRSAGAFTAAVLSNLSQANFWPSAARLRVFKRTIENN